MSIPAAAMSRRGRWSLSIAGTAVLLAAPVLLRRATADPVPPPPTLYYGGYLEEDGVPVERVRNIQVNLWDDPASTDRSSLRCLLLPTPTPVTKGRFRVALPDACIAAAQASANLWIEVIVDGQATPRSRIGAVPFAVAAQAVPWSGVAGIGAHTEWPGSLPWTKVSGAPDVAALVARIAALEAKRPTYRNPAPGGRSYSLDAGYCGSTKPIDGLVYEGNAVGYAAAKLKCEATCTSPSAHLCTGDELVRHLQTGGTPPPSAGWYASASLTSAGKMSDCNGFNSNSYNEYGAAFQSAPVLTACDIASPILCCD